MDELYASFVDRAHPNDVRLILFCFTVPMFLVLRTATNLMTCHIEECGRACQHLQPGELALPRDWHLQGRVSYRDESRHERVPLGELSLSRSNDVECWLQQWYTSMRPLFSPEKVSARYIQYKFEQTSTSSWQLEWGLYSTSRNTHSPPSCVLRALRGCYGIVSRHVN